MNLLRSCIASLLIFVLGTTSYAATIELTKSNAVITKENATKELVRGLDKAIKKEQKKATSIESLKQRAAKKVTKNFEKRKSLMEDIFKHEDQEKRLKVLDKKLKKLVKLDPTLAQVEEQADKIEMLISLEQQLTTIDQEMNAQIQAVNDELSQFDSTEAYLVDLKSKVQNDTLASKVSKSGRHIANIDNYDIYLATFYVLGTLFFIGAIYYLVISATFAIWAFSPALAIIFLLIML